MESQQQWNLFTVSPTDAGLHALTGRRDTGYLNWSWTLHGKQEAPCSAPGSALLVQDTEGLKDLYLDTNPQSEKH